MLFIGPVDNQYLGEKRTGLETGKNDGRFRLFTLLFLLNVDAKGSRGGVDHIEVLGRRGYEAILTDRRLTEDEAASNRRTHSISTTSLSSWTALGCLPWTRGAPHTREADGVQWGLSGTSSSDSLTAGAIAALAGALVSVGLRVLEDLGLVGSVNSGSLRFLKEDGVFVCIFFDATRAKSDWERSPWLLDGSERRG